MDDPERLLSESRPRIADIIASDPAGQLRNPISVFETLSPISWKWKLVDLPTVDHVRMLLDDNGIAGLDDPLAALDAHANVKAASSFVPRAVAEVCAQLR
ncbi:MULTISPECIES: hypothetical protein [Sphingobium]|uniref:hypothetical protein n=1 Tax=Sphingobium sp. MI1205 TaxID=407020 RepID=UPI00077030CC|nr:hypothetical protein [Sphingobium sp. MI1205]AMK17238.1 hypothetical protein K663_04265 [Sphingobium sp. MI1205]